ncbi:MAG: tRNA pseudouridine(55) synthase TruB [Bacteroidota bacterium]
MNLPDQLIAFQEGQVLLIDKPKDWTSFDVVNKIRHKLKRLLKVKKIKVGHSGTLDPMATGLLIICTGKFTKKLHDFQGLDKTYTGSLLLGATTPSYDAETPIDQKFPIDHIDQAAIEQARQGFLGEQAQQPPMFSAIKVDGQPLYKKARKGEKIEVKSRQITIHQFDVNAVSFPELQFEVSCSKGTYIRSLVHDFGKVLDSGAYMNNLRRTRIGDFKIEDAWNLEEFIDQLTDRFGPIEG